MSAMLREQPEQSKRCFRAFRALSQRSGETRYDRTMSDRLEVVEEIQSSNQLSENTRRERRNLLATSVLSIAVVQGRLMPTKIVMAGIEVSADNQLFLFRLVAVVIAYFLIAFLVYCWSEYGLSRFKLSLAKYERSRAALAGLQQGNSTQPTSAADSVSIPKLPSRT